MPGTPARRAFVVDKPNAVRALASPLRQSIVDTIVANGELSIAALAKRIHWPADRLYYHVGILEKVGILQGRESRSANGRSETLFDVPGRPMYVRYQPSSPANRRAIARIVASMLRAANRDFARGFSRKGVRVSGPHREVWAGRVQGHLTKHDLAFVNSLIHSLLDQMIASRGRRSSGKAFQVTWILSPTDSL